MKSFGFRVGDAQCVAIEDGWMVRPADEGVRDVPPETWKEALAQAGYSNGEMVFPYHYFYVRAGEHHVLLDAGIGVENAAESEAFAAKYKLKVPKVEREGSVADHLPALGVALDEVDWVVITHGDPDHVGGLVDVAGRPLFARAQYVMLQEAWDFWHDEATLARWPEFMTSFGRQILPQIVAQVRVVQAGEEFLPGFHLISAPGHRPGHTAVWIASGGEALLAVGDAVAHPLLAEHPSWQWTIDSDEVQALASRVQLLELAAREGALVAGAHLPFPGVGRVTPVGEGWRWEALG